MRILYVTTVGCTMSFFKAFIRELLEQGHQVDLAANYEEEAIPECFAQWGCRIYALSCTRSPLSAGNLHTVRQLKRLALKNHSLPYTHCGRLYPPCLRQPAEERATGFVYRPRASFL